jgi:hypothetical protein
LAAGPARGAAPGGCSLIDLDPGQLKWILLARESTLRERQLGNRLTELYRGECNALMVPDIDRPTRDPRALEDLIDAVELYGWYVEPDREYRPDHDAGISAARGW